MPTINEELRALGHLKDTLDAANAVQKTAEQEHKRHQHDVFQRMDDEGIESMRVDGVTYSPTATTFATIQDRAAFVKWAEKNQPDLLETKERAALCNALVREKLDNDEPLPDGLGHYDREYISQRTS